MRPVHWADSYLSDSLALSTAAQAAIFYIKPINHYRYGILQRTFSYWRHNAFSTGL